MKKFEFRLEPLLKVRSHVEKEKQKAHAAAQMSVQNQKAHLSEVESGRQKTIAHQRQVQKKRLSLAELLVCSRYLVKLKKDTMAGNKLLGALEKDAEEKRQELVEASRARKIFEKLKERQQEKYYKEAGAMEAKESDEVANTTFIRSKRT